MNEFRRRRYPRMKVPVPFACSCSRVGLRRWLTRNGAGHGVVFDVSMNGTKVMSEFAMGLGDRISLSFHLPTQLLPVIVDVATVRWKRDRTLGLEFINLSPVAQSRLRRFLEMPDNSH
ncbi:MAG: PilZ domain-containing protein [Nitrospiraceae bacterium]